MTKKITIRELLPGEINKLLADEKFKLLKPVKCSQCRQQGNFERRIFEITGVAKSKQADDETQKLLQYHFKHKHSIDFIFLKTYQKQFFVDSAICCDCKSTAIIYDVDLLDDNFISRAAKLTGKPASQIKRDLIRIHSRLKKTQ